MATQWKRSQDVVWEELDGAVLLVNPATGMRCHLNAAAAAVWKLCDGRHSVSELAAAVARSCEEVVRVCRQLSQIGLLSGSPALAGSSALYNDNSCMRNGLPVSLEGAPVFTLLGLGDGSRRRPSPRGNSGPG